jgi:hypothetical protein
MSDALAFHVITVRPVPMPMSDTNGFVIGTVTFSLHPPAIAHLVYIHYKSQ